MWQKALAIAAARAGEHTQRAASPADYHLTGLITCPDCVHSYVGTSATGRTRTYRYYTCLSRARYGPGGCPAPRLPAGETDAAVLQALCDFCANSTELIQDAVTRAQQRHRDGHASQRAEHAAILAQIKQKENSIDRYHAAFENSTMDDATAGQRLKTLHGQIAQLTIRADDLTEALSDEPAPPPPGVIEDLQAYLADAIASGTPAERKAAIEALVAEVRVTGHGLIPVFRIPSSRPPAPRDTTPPRHNTATTEPAVRTMLRSVSQWAERITMRTMILSLSATRFRYGRTGRGPGRSSSGSDAHYPKPGRGHIVRRSGAACNVRQSVLRWWRDRDHHYPDRRRDRACPRRFDWRRHVAIGGYPAGSDPGG